MEQSSFENLPPAGDAAPQPGFSWRVVGAAVRGASHERGELPCQDAQGYRLLPGGLIAVVVADGAGTARFSDEGAQAAVAEALTCLETSLNGSQQDDELNWEDLVRQAFNAARQAVLSKAQETGWNSREFACTLACAVVFCGGMVAGQIGDGAVVAQAEGGDLFTATRLQRGEYANETHFLVQEDALDQAVIEIHRCPVSALAVMSDGLIRLALKMPSQEPHKPFFQPLFRFAGSVENESEAAAKLVEFLNSERVNERTDDDKALVLAVRASQEPGPQ